MRKPQEPDQSSSNEDSLLVGRICLTSYSKILSYSNLFLTPRDSQISFNVCILPPFDIANVNQTNIDMSIKTY